MTEMQELRDAVRRRHARTLPTPRERRRIRERAGVSMRELAAAVGCAPATISRWESGDRDPTAPELSQRYQLALSVLQEEAQR